MALILCIDTATENALVCLSKDGNVLDYETNSNQKNHASFLHQTIQQLLKKNNCTIENLNAVAVTNGPGSYTGLRVGLASAKGICYALNIPLITINTLEVIANSFLLQRKKLQQPFFICPMIDARRMEVFTAVYNQDLTIAKKPQAEVVYEQFCSKFLEKSPVFFVGNCNDKVKKLLNNPNAHFFELLKSPNSISEIASQLFEKQQFTELSYSQPAYLKEFQH